MDLPHPKASPEYQSLCDIYMGKLAEFEQWELDEGLDLLLDRWRSKSWPMPSVIREACMEVRRDRRPPWERNRHALAPPEGQKRPIGREERERVRHCLAVLAKHIDTAKQGEPFGKTLAECKAEAKRRQMP